jgi:hypothetical protein
MVTAKSHHIAALLENQPDLSNVRIARLTGATEAAIRKQRAAIGAPTLAFRMRGKRT